MKEFVYASRSRHGTQYKLSFSKVKFDSTMAKWEALQAPGEHVNRPTVFCLEITCTGTHKTPKVALRTAGVDVWGAV